jgi:drug/metabolite transporter (DMT)-like permease
VSEDVAADPLAQATALMLGASMILLANVLRRPSGLTRLRAAYTPFASSGVVIAIAQTSLFEALDRERVTVVAPLVGTGVPWTVVRRALRRTHGADRLSAGRGLAAGRCGRHSRGRNALGGG